MIKCYNSKIANKLTQTWNYKMDENYKINGTRILKQQLNNTTTTNNKIYIHVCEKIEPQKTDKTIKGKRRKILNLGNRSLQWNVMLWQNDVSFLWKCAADLPFNKNGPIAFSIGHITNDVPFYCKVLIPFIINKIVRYHEIVVISLVLLITHTL